MHQLRALTVAHLEQTRFIGFIGVNPASLFPVFFIQPHSFFGKDAQDGRDGRARQVADQLQRFQRIHTNPDMSPLLLTPNHAAIVPHDLVTVNRFGNKSLYSFLDVGKAPVQLLIDC